MIDSNIATRNQGCCIKLQKVNLEIAKKGFYFHGGKLFNELPLEMRRSETLQLFKRELDKLLC